MVKVNNVQPLRSIEDIQKMKNSLIRYCSYRDYFLFVLGINTGFRISDILPLTVKDIRDKKHIVIKEKKTGKLRSIHVNKCLKKEIDEYTSLMSYRELLFPSRKGLEPITLTQAYRVLQKASKIAGIEHVGSRTLRKTFGYHHYQKHKDIAALQEFFSHPSIRITKLYIGVIEDEIEDKLK
ncbi:tyrosine-type recombinase/integrase [Bacillus altitudinis]|uniref:tyrosine-type recombinase/integrase n=1 Tax=Bacillus TaxID=1386 RepID=UPI0011A640FD|nr:tyrosine-type recombinase/integrase [Bacillus altitudinis]MDF9417436.1 site-specific integrase [Bacillus altitudinis]